MEKNEKETLDLKSICVRYLRHWKFFLAVFILSFIPAILYLSFYPRTYSFNMTVKLQKGEGTNMSAGLGQMTGMMKTFGIGTSGSSVNVDDEMAILSSNRMLRLMILDLGLNIEYTEPYSFYIMYGDAPLKLTADPGMLANLGDEYTLKVSVRPNHIKVKLKSKFGNQNETLVYQSLPAQIKVGEGMFVLDYNPDATLQEQEFQLHIRCMPARWKAEELGKLIKIEDVSNVSDMLMLNYTDHSLERGRDVLNTLIAKYNEDERSYKAISEHQTMEFVNIRMDSVEQALKNVEQEIMDFKTKNEMTLMESDIVAYSESVRDVQTKILEREANVRLLQYMDDFVKDPANKYKVVPLISIAGTESSLMEQYNLAIVERDQFLKNVNETNPLFDVVSSKVETMRSGVYITIENAQKGMIQTLNDLKEKEKSLLSKMKNIPEAEREFVELHRQQEILMGLYVMLLQKREETALALEERTEFARVIDPAFAAKKAVAPRKLHAAIAIMLLTLIIPIGYLLAKDIFLALKEEYLMHKQEPSMEQPILEPDDNLQKAITGEELLKRIHNDIH